MTIILWLAVRYEQDRNTMDEIFENIFKTYTTKII